MQANQSKLDEAIFYYQKAIELNPNSAEAYLDLAKIFTQQQQWQQAISYYQQAIELQPDNWDAMHHLGDALLNLQQWEQAANTYRRSIELNPNFAWSYYNLGEALLRLEDYEEAISAYQEASRIKPDLAEVEQKINDVIARRVESNSKLALKHNFQEIAENPQDTQADQKALAIEPNSLKINLSLGKALIEQEHYQDAIASYQKAFAISSNSSQVSQETLTSLLAATTTIHQDLLTLDEFRQLSHSLHKNIQDFKLNVEYGCWLTPSILYVEVSVKDNCWLFGKTQLLVVSNSNCAVAQASGFQLDHQHSVLVTLFCQNEVKP